MFQENLTVIFFPFSMKNFLTIKSGALDILVMYGIGARAAVFVCFLFLKKIMRLVIH